MHFLLFYARPHCGIYFLLAHMKASEQTQLSAQSQID
jgi:hypothetical protein